MKTRRWHPYLSGALAGGWLVLCVWLTGRCADTAPFFTGFGEWVKNFLTPYRGVSSDRPLTTGLEFYQALMLATGMTVGAFVAAVTSGHFCWRGVPHAWEVRFGPDRVKRAFAAFLGGAFMIWGADLAGGSLVSDAMVGLASMSLASYLSVLCFFAGGILTARGLYRGGAFDA